MAVDIYTQISDLKTKVSILERELTNCNSDLRLIYDDLNTARLLLSYLQSIESSLKKLFQDLSSYFTISNRIVGMDRYNVLAENNENSIFQVSKIIIPRIVSDGRSMEKEIDRIKKELTKARKELNDTITRKHIENL